MSGRRRWMLVTREEQDILEHARRCTPAAVEACMHWFRVFAELNPPEGQAAREILATRVKTARTARRTRRAR